MCCCCFFFTHFFLLFEWIVREFIHNKWLRPSITDIDTHRYFKYLVASTLRGSGFTSVSQIQFNTILMQCIHKNLYSYNVSSNSFSYGYNSRDPRIFRNTPSVPIQHSAFFNFILNSMTFDAWHAVKSLNVCNQYRIQFSFLHVFQKPIRLLCNILCSEFSSRLFRSRLSHPRSWYTLHPE